MAEKNLNLIFYHYIHQSILEKFGKSYMVPDNEVCKFLAVKFRVPRQIKRKLLWDLQSLGLIDLIRGGSIIVKDAARVLHI